MNKLLLALVVGVLSGVAAAQTGIVNTATIADHGTPAMHAEESAKNVVLSRQTKGLQDAHSRQQAVKDSTKNADHGTQTSHAEEASRNVLASAGQPKVIGTNRVAQDAVLTATKGQTK